jgi:hypothetical protein
MLSIWDLTRRLLSRTMERLLTNASRSRRRLPSHPNIPFLTSCCPWPLVAMAAQLPGSWLLGFFFGQGMLSVSGLHFLVFDFSLPVLEAVSSAINNNRKEKFND